MRHVSFNQPKSNDLEKRFKSRFSPFPFSQSSLSFATSVHLSVASNAGRFIQCSKRALFIFCSALTSALQDRGARSYAQATAGQNNGPGESEGRTHHRTNPTNCRLRFYVNNKACPSSYTIFQAVNDLARAQRSELQANESAGQYGRRRRLWEDTHTIHYSRYSFEAALTENILRESRFSRCPFAMVLFIKAV